MDRELRNSAIAILFLISLLVGFRCSHCQDENTKHKLIHLQILNRHGERNPLYFYPTDPNPPEAFPGGKGSLTKRGKRIQYEVGKLLRSMYSDFITSNPNEVFVNSTSMDYSIQSAQSLLSSLYAPTPEWSFLKGFNWQPIPIHFEADHLKDELVFLRPCNRIQEETEKVLDLPSYGNALEKFKPMLQNVLIFSGIMNDTRYMYNILLMIDCLKMEKASGLAIPWWAEYYWDELDELFDFIFNSWFKSDVVREIYSTFLIQAIVGNTEKKIAGELPDKKVQVYSIHDRNLAVMLMAMQIYNGKKPPLSSTLVLELYESPDNRNSVRFLYLNSTEQENGFKEYYVLTVRGCTEYCPYEYFLNITKELVEDDRAWDDKCGNFVE